MPQAQCCVAPGILRSPDQFLPTDGRHVRAPDIIQFRGDSQPGRFGRNDDHIYTAPQRRPRQRGNRIHARNRDSIRCHPLGDNGHGQLATVHRDDLYVSIVNELRVPVVGHGDPERETTSAATERCTIQWHDHVFLFGKSMRTGVGQRDKFTPFPIFVPCHEKIFSAREIAASHRNVVRRRHDRCSLVLLPAV